MNEKIESSASDKKVRETEREKGGEKEEEGVSE